MAPIGVFLTSLIGRPLVVYLKALDVDNGFIEEYHPPKEETSELPVVIPTRSLDNHEYEMTEVDSPRRPPYKNNFPESSDKFDEEVIEIGVHNL